MSSRRRAREAALQILFGLDWQPSPTDFALSDYWARFAGELPAAYDEVRRHCAELVVGVQHNLAAIDMQLQASTHNWKLDRMSAVDRNILRLAAFELLFAAEQVPQKVAINEAIEVAKKFGNEDSSVFVNGVLDRIAHENAGAVSKGKKQFGKSGKSRGSSAKSSAPATPNKGDAT